jgi:hypothetical protein
MQHSSYVWDLQYNDTHLVTTGGDGYVNVYDVNTRQRLRNVLAHTSASPCCPFRFRAFLTLRAADTGFSCCMADNMVASAADDTVLSIMDLRAPVCLSF